MISLWSPFRPLWVALTVTAVAGLTAGGDAADEPDRPPVLVVAFSPDGKWLAAGTGMKDGPGRVTVWDLATQQARWVHREDKAVRGAVFSPDGCTLAVASSDRTARLFDAANGRLTTTLRRHDRGVAAVAFSPDGRILATAGKEGIIQFWDVAAKTERITIKEHVGLVAALAFSPDGQLLASAGGERVSLWEAATGLAVRDWKAGPSWTSSVLFSPDGRWLLTGNYAGGVSLWHAQTGLCPGAFTQMGGVYTLAYAPATRTVAAGGYDPDVHLLPLDLEDPGEKDLARIRALVAELDDGRYEVRERAGRELRKIGFPAEAELRRVTETTTSVEVRIRTRRLRADIFAQPGVALPGHRYPVRSVAFSPDGRYLASGGNDGLVRLWDVAARTEVGRLVAADPRPNSP